MSIRRTMTVTATALLCTLVLAGCGPSVSGYPVFDRPQEQQDALPEQLPDYALEDLDVESSRFVGTHETAELWLTRRVDTDAVCIVVYPSSEQWHVACGGASGPLRSAGPTGRTFLVQVEAAPEPENGIKISENVFVLESQIQGARTSP